MIIRLVAAELFHADRQTDRHDEDNSRFPQFCEGALKSVKYEERYVPIGK